MSRTRCCCSRSVGAGQVRWGIPQQQTSASGTITRVAGTGASGESSDDGPASEAQLTDPRGLAVTADGGFPIAAAFNNGNSCMFNDCASATDRSYSHAPVQSAAIGGKGAVTRLVKRRMSFRRDLPSELRAGSEGAKPGSTLAADPPLVGEQVLALLVWLPAGPE